MLLCTATDNGTTTTFIDTLNLNHEISILRNRHGIFSGGTAANLERVVRVESNVKSTQTITFTPAVPSTTAIADELELWNQRDEGITSDVVHDTLNDAIADVYEYSPVPVTADAFTFDSASPIIDIDLLEVATVVDGTNWEAITRVEYRATSDDPDVTYSWIKLPSDDSNIDVDRNARTITLKGRARYLADGNSVRIHGANISGSLTIDSSTTQVNAEWLAHEVAARVLYVRLEKAFDRKDLDITRAGLQAKADALRPRAFLRLRGRYWRLS
jgi:Ni,Fe-hydrogenase I large subunit